MPQIKIDPSLVTAAHANPERFVTVVITYRDPAATNRDSIRAYTGGPQDTHTHDFAGPAVAQRLKARRAGDLGNAADTLETRHGATVLPQRFAFAHALVVRMKLKEVLAVAMNPQVVRIDPLWGDGPPQTSTSCGTSEDRVEEFRSVMDCEPYLEAGFGTGTVMLIDTGVDSEHTLLNSGQVMATVDCVSNPELCRNGDAAGDVYPGGHGTASAAMLSANDALGESDQGMTSASIGSFRVYGIPPGAADVQVNYAGAAEALDQIVGGEPDIVVVEVATGYGGYGTLTEQAGWAFDRGAVVIAANGNADTRTLPQPANSPRALGVGMYCIQDPGTFRTDAAWGVTPDQRIKPDLGAPTGAYTAAVSTTDPSKLATFSGTSGATPAVGAAALLLRNWMKSGGRAVLPGNVYAMLLACGNSAAVDATEGAGRITLPTGGLAWWSSIPIENGEQEILEFDTGSLTASGLVAAIWWPEYGTGAGMIPDTSERAYISLQAFDPNGQASEVSEAASVFQRVTLRPSSVSTNHVWKIQITGSYVPGSSRDVYYAVWAKP